MNIWGGGRDTRELPQKLCFLTMELIQATLIWIHLKTMSTLVFKHFPEVFHPHWNIKKPVKLAFLHMRKASKKLTEMIQTWYVFMQIILFSKSHASWMRPGRTHSRLYVWSKTQLSSGFDANSNRKYIFCDLWRTVIWRVYKVTHL